MPINPRPLESNLFSKHPIVVSVFLCIFLSKPIYTQCTLYVHIHIICIHAPFTLYAYIYIYVPCITPIYIKICFLASVSSCAISWFLRLGQRSSKQLLQKYPKGPSTQILGLFMGARNPSHWARAPSGVFRILNSSFRFRIEGMLTNEVLG